MKKIISLLLAVVCAAGMTAVAFAANPKITEQTSALNGLDVGERGPGYKIWIPLKQEAFKDAEEDLTMADVKASKITVKQTAKAGSKAIASVELKEDSNKVANILVTLTDPFTSTKPLDFETSIYLYIDGKRQDFETKVTGTLSNGEITVVADTDYVDLSGGYTVVCEETTGKIEVYIGREVSIFMKMLKGKEYYGTVSIEPTNSDMDVMDKYSDIDEVYNLNTINLKGSGNIVKIDSPDANYFVYNADLEYLGKTSDMLPYSDKYYLAVKQLDVEPGDEEPNDEEPGDEPSGEPSDDEAPDLFPDVAPSQGNNPDTGISPLFAVAIASGAASLAVMVTILRRKNN